MSMTTRTYSIYGYNRRGYWESDVDADSATNGIALDLITTSPNIHPWEDLPDDYELECLGQDFTDIASAKAAAEAHAGMVLDWSRNHDRTRVEATV